MTRNSMIAAKIRSDDSIGESDMNIAVLPKVECTPARPSK
jgi:hypothetical protein